MKIPSLLSKNIIPVIRVQKVNNQKQQKVPNKKIPVLLQKQNG